MQPGRRPKPTALKLLQGNPGKRRLNQNEPKPKKSFKAPSCPTFLSKRARAEWRRIAKELHQMGLLTGLDVAVLASYCVSYGRLREAEEHLKKEDAVITTTQGNKIQNPWVSLSNKSMDQIRRFVAELGLSASARGRIEVQPIDPGKSLEDLLK